MAHQLTTTAGKVEMAYVGETPWHGLGQALKPGASIDTWIEEAGMAWTIRKTKLMYYADRKQTDLREDDESVALIRSDTGARLGIVSSDYQIVQPYEILEFFRDLVAGSGFEMHTAGTLFGGKRFWALAKLTEAKLAGWDNIGGYYLLSTTADGTRATDGRETSVRVVCNNTLSVALLGDGLKHGFKLSHRQRFVAETIQKQLGLSRENFERFVEAANVLTKARVSAAAADDFLLRLLRGTSPDQEVEEPKAEAEQLRRPRGLDKILGLFQGAGMGSTQAGSAGTAWGLVNAVTEYVDHHATSKSVDHRLDRAFWGSGDELKTQAMSKAIELLV